MPRLAKLTPPRLGDAHPRERLFLRLDAARRCAGVWVAGPPGSGKTTLIASYLQARPATTRWYQVDASDADPATLFHLLRATLAARRAAALPVFSPDGLANLEGHARRYFRLLYARLAKPLVMVFDNAQEAGPASSLPLILRSAMLEAPAGVNVIVACRDEPPATFARLAAGRQLDTLGWEDLRLDADEAAAIAALQGVNDARHATRLLEASAGWAAGLQLLARAATPGDDIPAVDPAGMSVPQLLFDYLVSEVFDAAPAALRKLWLSTALAPHFTAKLAQALSGDRFAAHRLDELCKRRHFVDRIPIAPPVYRYHALFRAFLLERRRHGTSPAAQRRHARRTAGLLESQGDTWAAFDLHCEGEDWAPAARLVAREAAGLLAAGRLHTLAARIARLPAACVEGDPWLLLWRGCCAGYAGAGAAARRDLARAFELHAARVDVVGQCLAAALVLEGYFLEWNVFDAVDHWAAVLRDLLAAHPEAFADAALELHIQTALLLASSLRTPQHASTQACAQRVLQLSRMDIGPAERMNAGLALLQYGIVEESHENTARLVAEFDALARASGTPPTQRALWLAYLGLHRSLAAEGQASAAPCREAVDVCVSEGLSHLVNFVRLLSIGCAIEVNGLESAKSDLRSIEPTLHGLRSTDLVLYHVLRAWLALLEGAPQLALEQAGIAAQMAPQQGHIGPLCSASAIHSQALIACGEFERALAAARVPQPFVGRPGVGSFRFSALMFEADALAHLQRREEHLEVLRAALETGRRGGFLNLHIPLPAMAARLCAAALEAGIETEYVERLIRARRLLPPTPQTAHWPWPVRIRALGGLAVSIDGVPLASKGKTQRRPLGLLKLLVAHGDRPVDHATPIDRLWPDLAGDAARDAFDAALHRLRRLLVHADAVQLEDGRLRLDPRRVWTDVRAFEHLCSRIETGTAPAPPQAGEVLLDLYRGALLPGEEMPTVEPMRQRLRRKFELAVAQLAAKAADEHALVLRHHAVEIEPQSEALLHGLIEILRRCGRSAEAVGSYQRFRDLLASTSGLAPSADLQALHRSLQQQG